MDNPQLNVTLIIERGQKKVVHPGEYSLTVNLLMTLVEG